MPLHGFIFDLDGVLTDTAEFHYQAWQRLADDLGVPFDRKRNEPLRGVSRRQSLELLLAGRVYPEAQMREMMERKNRYYQELLKQVTPDDLLPGARPLLDELRMASMKIAIGSASKNAREVVQRFRSHRASTPWPMATAWYGPSQRQTCSSMLLVCCVCVSMSASSSRMPQPAWRLPKSPACMPWVSAQSSVWARPTSCCPICPV